MLLNAMGDRGVRFPKKALRRGKVQRYLRHNGMGGGQIPSKKALRTI